MMMNINRMTDEELAKELFLMEGGFGWERMNPDLAIIKRYIKRAKFIHQCVKDSRKDLVEALSRIKKFKGNMDCEKVYEIIKQALASVKEVK